LEAVSNPLITFAESLHIRDSDGLRRLRLYPYQREVLDAVYRNRFTVACMPKRCGKTLLAATVALYYATIRQDFRVVILSTSREQAQTVAFDYVKRLIKWNAEAFANTIKSESQVRLETKDGSIIETVPCLAASLAGKRIDLLLIDELAFIEDEETVQVALSQTEGRKSKVFITSTASDTEHLLYRLYRDAEELGVRFVYYGIEAYSQAKHISDSFLEERRKMMPEYLFRRYHANEFGVVGETVFKPEWIEAAKCDYSLSDLEEAKEWLAERFGEKVVGWIVSVGLDRAMPYANRDMSVAVTTMLARFNSEAEVFLVLKESVFPTGSFEEITTEFEFLIERFRPAMFVLESYQAGDIGDWLRKIKRKEVELVPPTPQNIKAAFGFAIRQFQNGRIIIPANSLMAQQLVRIRAKEHTFEGKPHDDAVFALVWSLQGCRLGKITGEPFLYIIDEDGIW